MSAVPTVLLWGTITSAISCLTGYLLSISDDYDKTIVSWHLWMALSLLFVSFLLYLKVLNKQFAINKRLLSVSLLLLIGITGHLGGSLTHGSDYLTKPFKDIFYIDSTANTTIQPIANVPEAIAYDEVVRPILQTKCFSCHNSTKQKGGLRMDEPASLMKGGKDGKVIEAGNAEISEMIQRLMLPTDNDKHMPPKEKPQPTESQVALLHWWINNGADFTRKVKAMQQTGNIKSILAALQQPAKVIKKEPADIPVELVEKADEKILAQLKARSISILPVAQNSNYLAANFITSNVVAIDDLQLLASVKKQLVWLKLENTNIGDNTSADLARLTNLTRLNIANTQLTDKGIAQLASLSKLQYLNLTGTKVSLAGLMYLKSLAKLQNIYLYQSSIKAPDYAHLKKLFPLAVIDTGGYYVPTLAADTTIIKDGKEY